MKAEVRGLAFQDRLDKVARQQRIDEYRRERMDLSNEASDATYWANKRSIEELNEKV